MVDLEQLGWDAEWNQLFEPHRAAGFHPGRVALEGRHGFTVVTHEGEVSARAAGRLFHNASRLDALPKVGDWVALSRKPRETRSVIQHVLPRRTALTRKMAGRETIPQVLAANIDVAFVVQALDATFNPRRLERFLVMVHEGGATPVIVLNKADLTASDDPRVTETRAAAGPTPVIVASTISGQGIVELRQFLAPGKTGVFVGASGVGKSSLINSLYEKPIQATLEVREQDSKGRHTTTWRELILLPGGGLVIDTPGLREFHLWLAEGGLEDAFPDIAEVASTCALRACSHTVEKGCAVQRALAEGTLTPERFASFQKLRKELEHVARDHRDHTYVARRREAILRRRRAFRREDDLSSADLESP